MKIIPFSTLMVSTMEATTAQNTKIQTVQEIYGCFGRGDIPTLMGKLSENAVFESNGNLPWSGRREGLANIGGFFQAIGSNAQVTVFQPSNFRIEGDRVVNDCRFGGVAIPTGKTFGYDLVMSWTFDSAGRPLTFNGNALEDQLPQAEAAFR